MIAKISFVDNDIMLKWIYMLEHSPVIEVAKKVCPAVITIVISKNLPKIEGFYFFPFGKQQKEKK